MFVILEGIENSGKTTIVERMVSKYPIIKKMELEKFPNCIKTIIKQYENGNVIELTEAQVNSVRQQKEADYIEQFIGDKKKILIVTGYLQSDMAFAKSLGMDTSIIERLAEKLPQPDCKIFLEVSPENSIQRSGNLDTLDREQRVGNLQEISSNFNEIIVQDGDWHRIDTNALDDEEVCTKVVEIVNSL